ncbi:hypothetical protein H6P81_002893 [Aristolochia fimbriata]|uniref:Uncharacterized protein n=1 Tax=Aristolochia fimbriata TaxID=158543 RepID=A0AAV7FB11_ARIFI|nr:hypothetical protein H6P81_002893 [Aristolochia fimbriata]
MVKEWETNDELRVETKLERERERWIRYGTTRGQEEKDHDWNGIDATSVGVNHMVGWSEEASENWNPEAGTCRSIFVAASICRAFEPVGTPPDPRPEIGEDDQGPGILTRLRRISSSDCEIARIFCKFWIYS